ncbi:DinB family protein [Arthrobacter sp. zg-Y820]|uniref:DinB family protein n=1 Tax=unclassified Arthrobacter TaxID=235627 RepID=UPI001E3AF9E5|nr:MULTISPECIES: DinB family protein [unclassified Arthrobacter]MCC9197768.1 DinB family protein [Arthrobacter sp. zg-Y820]MDK1280635.1 DinB family protein [Arthrobacter sp. zg.Y820]WIB10732.1 DinB family protein [Arthrobacter sp. zg-Y820]
MTADDLTTDLSVDDRPEPPDTGTEREILCGFLDYLRASAVFKARGLSDTDAARRLLPSLTTVSGLLRHLADVERTWFRGQIDGQAGVSTRWSDEEPDGEFLVSPEDSLADIMKDYEEACAESREVLSRYNLDDPCSAGSSGHNVRWVVTHMIEETGRHCGHLDIVRELLDGTTGE